jgi:predicted dinucleotide-binding enzyme
MKIGIIGAGHIGGTLTRRLCELGHDVRVANSRGRASLQELADETGATPVDVVDAALDAEIVIVTIPENKVPELPKGFLDGAAQNVVVIDTGNYYPQQRDGRIADIEDGMSESRWVATQIGYPVVKAFNGIQWSHLLSFGKAKGELGRIALPVAGDDHHAKKIVMELVDQLGFDPVDAGDLDDSWRQEPGTPVYGADLDVDGVRLALTEAIHLRSPAFRA